MIAIVLCALGLHRWREAGVQYYARSTAYSMYTSVTRLACERAGCQGLKFRYDLVDTDALRE